MLTQHAASRIRGFGTSIFSEMSRLALEHNAVNLSQGFPDFPGPDYIKAAAIAAINADLNQYAPSHGLPALRQAVAAKLQRYYGLQYDADTEVTVTSGATEALFSTITALVEPGDEVVIFQPFYDAYPPDVVMAGGVPRYVTLRPPDWRFDPDELRRAFSPRTKAVVVNTPHNPTGKVYSRAELQLIADLCHEYDALAISDEVYDHLTFDGCEHIPMATLPGMRERTVTVNSSGKTFSLTGWKIGYVTAPAATTAAIRRVHQFVTFATSTPFQVAAAVALTEAEQHGYYAEFRAMYTAKRDKLNAALTAASLTPMAVQGTYFTMADTSAFGFADDVAFARYLTTEAGVACIPPSAFYQEADKGEARHLARFCFAKTEPTLDEAARRLQTVGAKLNRQPATVLYMAGGCDDEAEYAGTGAEL